MRQSAKVWPMRQRRDTGAGVDAYSPSSPSYAERHRETQTRLPCGTVCVEYGSPVFRLPGEGVRIAPNSAPASPPPVEPQAVPQEPVPAQRELRAPDLKPGLGKPDRAEAQ